MARRGCRPCGYLCVKLLCRLLLVRVKTLPPVVMTSTGPKEPLDHLNLAKDKKALKALASNSASNGRVLFSAKMIKINRKGKGQNRVLLITTRHLLNLMPDNYSKCNRCMAMGSLHHISTSLQGQEFVMHFTDEYDYRFRSPYCTQVNIAVDRCHEVPPHLVNVALAGHRDAHVCLRESHGQPALCGGGARRGPTGTAGTCKS